MAAPGSQQEMFSRLKAELPAQLPAYLKKQRWFGAKAREILSTQVLDVIPLQSDGCDALVALVKVETRAAARICIRFRYFEAKARELPQRIWRRNCEFLVSGMEKMWS